MNTLADAARHIRGEYCTQWLRLLVIGMVYRDPWQPPRTEEEPRRNLLGGAVIFVLLAAGVGLVVFALAPRGTHSGPTGDPWSVAPPEATSPYYLCGPRPDPPPPPFPLRCEEHEVQTEIDCREESGLVTQKKRNPRAPGRCFACMMHFGGRITPKLLEGDERIRLPTQAIFERIEGLVLVKCTLTETGTVTQCHFIKTLPWVEEGILANLYARRYEPILFQGKPTSMQWTFTYRFPYEPCVLEGLQGP